MEDADLERFVCDAMLGRLTTYLRMCGYDVAYAPDRGVEADDAIVALADDEDRVILTRDADLAARAPAVVLLSEMDIDGQLRELQRSGYDLSLSTPTRCSTCNGTLDRVESTQPTPDHAPDPRTTAVWRCRSCGQHYWQGSHWDDVADRLHDLTDG